MLLLREAARIALRLSGFAIPSRFALHEYELNIVLDDRVRFEGLSKEPTAILHLIICVRNLVPDYWIQIIKPEQSALNANIRVQRNHHVAAVKTSR
jgi:hypothetical protein